MKKTKIIPLLCVLLGVFLVFGTIYVNYSKSQEERYTYQTYTGKMRIQDYIFIEDGKAVVTKLKQDTSKDYVLAKKYSPEAFLKRKVPIAVNDKYLIYVEANLKNSNKYYNYLPQYIQKQEGETLNLVIYKEHNSQLKYEKSIDVFKLQRELNSLIVLQNSLLTLKGGNTGFAILANNRGYFIDINSGKVVDSSHVEGKNNGIGIPDSSIVFNDLVEPNEEINRFHNLGKTVLSSNASTFDQDTLGTIGPKLPISSKYLDAYHLLLEKGSTLSLMVDNMAVDVKTDAEILGLFNENGFNGVFQNLPISKGNSVDGEEHIVNSYDEFMKTYDFEHID